MIHSLCADIARTWVEQSLGRATQANKAAVQAEIKALLYQAHVNKAEATTDWSKVELKSYVCLSSDA